MVVKYSIKHRSTGNVSSFEAEIVKSRNAWECWHRAVDYVAMFYDPGDWQLITLEVVLL